MGGRTGMWLITAFSLILLGGISFIFVMTVLKWDFEKLSLAEYRDADYTLSEGFENISVTVKNADVEFKPAFDGKTRVVCHEQQKMPHSVSVKSGTLVIGVKDSRSWYEHIGFWFGSEKITVYIPEKEYGILSVKSDTGDIIIPAGFGFESMEITASTGDITNYAPVFGSMEITASMGNIHTENISAERIVLSVTTGRITASGINCEGGINVKVSTGKSELSDIMCESFRSDGNTGDIRLKNVIVQGKLEIERSTGNVSFDGCDAGSISVETDTGDVSGSFLSSKVFTAETDTGRINVPKNGNGGRCEIETDTGDIKITVK